ncbi:hypothetical protein Acry_1503 [Acidiphilium cryptum JF-5]|uniref:Uncharacterized protein n=1 Tax=Acidiphilium cryptum (strain JF-5) TaxID=349163 RepID=A5FYM9_ACICJ|nr:hypothetical protein Acry_1503 [Acidiphilium cryptum JF-5]
MQATLLRPVEPLPRDALMQPRQGVSQRSIGQSGRWRAGLVSWSKRSSCRGDDHVGEAQPLDGRAAEGKIDLPDQGRGEMLKRQRVWPRAADRQRTCGEFDGVAARRNFRSGDIAPVGDQRAEHRATPPKGRPQHGGKQGCDAARRVVPRRFRCRHPGSRRRFS